MTEAEINGELAVGIKRACDALADSVRLTPIQAEHVIVCVSLTYWSNGNTGEQPTHAVAHNLADESTLAEYLLALMESRKGTPNVLATDEWAV